MDPAQGAPRRAFVTGGSGFVGRELIAMLVGKGYEVRALARSPKAEAAVRAAGATPVSGDLDDEAALRQGMSGCGVVFHSAAMVALWGSREQAMRDNVGGTEHVLAAARAASVSRLVHISTEAVLADGHPIVEADETRPLPAKPVGIYPLTKGLAEQRVLAAHGGGLETMIVRPRFIWGRGDTSVLPQITLAARQGKLVWVDGGRYRTSTCHVKNVCQGAILAAERGRGGEVYFLTDGEPVEFRRFITALLRSQGVEPGTREVPGWVVRLAASVSEGLWRLLPLPGQPPLNRTAANLFFGEVTVRADKAKQELGYEPEVSVAEGLAEMGAPGW
ncbi:MAG TPA: NAD-dependent epimerase/dehydratase family protein [Polyangia bacterium]|jgi:nucleoside-diphosphate-sugar epimerase|nr:NAD-dependent epimerase/dehydratase family protein [Polyangia bacterium]